MCNQKGESDFLASKISQLQENQKILAKYIVEIKHRLVGAGLTKIFAGIKDFRITRAYLTEQFSNRPEIEQISILENALVEVHQQLDRRSIPPEAQVELVN